MQSYDRVSVEASERRCVGCVEGCPLFVDVIWSQWLRDPVSYQWDDGCSLKHNQHRAKSSLSRWVSLVVLSANIIQARSLYNQPFCQWFRRKTCQNVAGHRQPASRQISSYSPSTRHHNSPFSQRVCKPGYRATGKIIAVTARHPASWHCFQVWTRAVRAWFEHQHYVTGSEFVSENDRTTEFKDLQQDWGVSGYQKRCFHNILWVF